MAKQEFNVGNESNEKTFQDSLCTQYQDNLVATYKKGKEIYVVMHFNSCTLLSRCNDSKKLNELNESLSISSDTIKQVEFTKEVLENRLGYRLIKTNSN